MTTLLERAAVIALLYTYLAVVTSLFAVVVMREWQNIRSNGLQDVSRKMQVEWGKSAQALGKSVTALMRAEAAQQVSNIREAAKAAIASITGGTVQ